MKQSSLFLATFTATKRAHHAHRRHDGDQRAQIERKELAAKNQRQTNIEHHGDHRFQIPVFRGVIHVHKACTARAPRGYETTLPACRHALGVCPMTRVNSQLKFDLLKNPTANEICRIVWSVVVNSFAASFTRKPFTNCETPMSWVLLIA